MGGGRLEDCGSGGLLVASQQAPSRALIKWLVIECFEKISNSLSSHLLLLIIIFTRERRREKNIIIKIKHNNINDVILSSAAFSLKNNLHTQQDKKLLEEKITFFYPEFFFLLIISRYLYFPSNLQFITRKRRTHSIKLVSQKSLMFRVWNINGIILSSGRSTTGSLFVMFG